jgi:hypothetical protein
MQPHGAQWKPNPQPLRTKVMGAAAGCGRADAIGEACAPIEKHDASTPQARTNDNLLNMDKTLFWQPAWEHWVVLLEMEARGARFLSKSRAVSPRFSARMANFGFNPRTRGWDALAGLDRCAPALRAG